MKMHIHIIGVKQAARRTALGCLLLLALVGNTWAQSDSPFVIKTTNHYLGHVKIETTDTTYWKLTVMDNFHPDSCLWYSGPTYNPTGYTHNYYFEDDAHNLRFLAAPLVPNSTLSLSNSLPSVSMLRNTDQVYYFYNWDPETDLNGVPEGGGVAKGHRYYVNTEEECDHCGEHNGASWYVDPVNGKTQCWEVYWIENNGNEWRLSSASHYSITEITETDKPVRYRKVTITEHEKEVTAGGLTTMTAPTEMNFGDDPAGLSAPVSSTYSYTPAYTNYDFLESGSHSVHNYWGSTDHLAVTPTPQTDVNIVGSISYQWTISGDALEYLSFDSGSDVNTSTNSSPTLYYRVANNTGHKTATITVTVTYTDANSVQTTQTRTATVLVKTPCQNPAQAAAPVVTNVGVTVSWTATANKYKVDWKKHTSDSYGTPVEVIGATSYTITGLDYSTQYDYRVTAYCGGDDYETPPTNPTGTFTTTTEPGLLVNGAIFGGGRMANVGGKTEIIVVNCDSIGAIFGGNDIAGEVKDANGSKIMLGVNSGDATYGSYGHTTDTIKFGSVYGGGNGYYAYNGESFVAAAWDTYESQTVPNNGSVMAMTQNHTVGDAVWTNTSGAPKTLDFPSIVKTAITVSNDYVKADSIFGGAKNAFLTAGTGNGSTITINGGTIMAVFGGNNFGGGQGYGIHYIEVNGTKTKLALDIQNSATKGYGRTFGIRDLFGGGNKVYGSTTTILIKGGQIDNVFGGGNSADVYAANVTVNCALGAYSSEHPYTFGNTYTNAIPTSYSSGDISIKDDYAWDGKGIYNVRNLYGGNNMEAMAGVPSVTLTSGSVGTVYGGGNAGDMLAQANGSFYEDGNDEHQVSFQYSTSVTLNSANMIVDYLYGGCRMSNVDYSTWVEIQNGHVGTAFGGCNVSGDVGSTRTKPNAATGTKDYQAVQGGTYVHAKGGTVYKNLFAGGNGFYHCNENFRYVNVNNISYTNEYHVGKLLPTHNETHVYVSPGATVKGNVYAGGNLAPVGFPDGVASEFPSFPTNTVGWALVHVYGGTVLGNVFGGGNMADIYGNNDVMVAGGTIAAVYGGNDRTGSVAGEYSNRILPDNYQYATDGYTSLIDPEVHAYVRITGNPTIQEVYGGGNGDYDYEHGDEVVYKYCNENEEGPIQSNTFVDININGGSSGGHIGTVYGGGDGVTATGFITVLMNIVEPVSPEDHDNVGVVFGGNNKGDLELLDEVPDIILLHGQVGTVYGGCNEGAMIGSAIIKSTDDAETYSTVGSLVRLRRRYTANGNTVYPTAKVSKAIYGGCRMNGVAHNSLVLVEGGNFYNAPIFGGSDISGTVGEWSKVVVRDDAAAGTGNGVAPIVGNLYGGGNGNYFYKEVNNVGSSGTHFEVYTDASMTPSSMVADSVYSAPICANSGVTILSGQVGKSGDNNARDIFGGGLGHETETKGNVTVNIGVANAASAAVSPVIYGDIYGGSALGYVNTNDENTTSLSNITTSTTVNFLNGTLYGNVYGGGLGSATLNSYGYIDTSEPVTEAYVYGTVHVNIGSPQANATNTTYSNNVNIDGSVFGGNNLAGTPKANVYVDVYRTAHDANNAYPSSFPNPLPNSFFDGDTHYALHEVYGGGNLAAYVPALTDAASLVHVHNCDNTIQYVYGGGNAADVPTSDVTIDGGMIQYVFGGGNGYGEGNPGANVLGDNTLNLNGGVMCYVFGGSNTKGGVAGTTDLNFAEEPSCSVRSINELYGGGNQAPDEDGITLNVPCGTSGVKVIYGGSRMADVGAEDDPQDVVLNVRGGELDKVFGGNNQGGTIFGDVTVNLYGGTITNVFGGNNQGGNVEGLITVNVVDAENGTCPLILTNVFGGGNEVAYAPADPTITSPVVNVTHITEKTGALGIKGNVYGGGNEAGVTSNPQVNIGTTSSGRAYVIGGVYGGCNTSGTVGGSPSVNINNGTVGVENNANRGIVYGGGLGNATIVKGSIAVTINDANAVLWGDVYGGSAKGLVNYDEANTAATPSATTTVTLTNGTIHGNLYGGGHGLDNAAANVWGPIAVQVNGGTVNSVFGGNNLSGTPKDQIEVAIGGGQITNVFGGGNQAAYIPTAATTNYPAVNISGGQITNIVVGGGKSADVGDATHLANPVLTISGGRLCTVESLENVGIYGGCYTSGTVYGDVTMTITGSTASTASQTTIGSEAALQLALDQDKNPISVHGGGYGENTNVWGDVTVNYGAADQVTTPHCDYPMLYGDLYGGSALGKINTKDNGATNATTSTEVNVMNGSVKWKTKVVNSVTHQYGGNIYGGGLGEKNGVNGGTSNIAALVYGEIHVNIGAEKTAESGPFGQASLIGCNVYGCNNINGSPQQNVYVDVYQTNHTTTDTYDYNPATNNNIEATYAIANVFGGGNRAHYQPDSNPSYDKKVHNTVHYCENTIDYVYGGGNAADVDGTVVWVDGGRFHDIFGGGNGQVSAANVLDGSVTLTIRAGHVGWYYVGCNLHGNVGGDPDVVTGCSGDDCCEEALVVENYYFGANEATIYDGLDNVINCGDNMNFVKVFAGSRLAVVYGDIKLTVKGGTITHLFGGSEGSNQVSADVRKYPATDAELALLPAAHQAGVQAHLTAHPEDKGKGGNIYLTLEGGHITNVYGGNDQQGNVEGEIIITVDSTQVHPCELDIDYIYGGNNLANYTPTNASQVSPRVLLQHGHVNQDVFGGSKGDAAAPNTRGKVTSHPKVVIGDLVANHKALVKGDVFGGGSSAEVQGDTKVILKGKTVNDKPTTRINGDVFGGSKLGDVTGNTDVVVVTPTPMLFFTQLHGKVTVTFTDGDNNIHTVSSGDEVAAGTVLTIKVVPAAGYDFNNWTATGGTLGSTTALTTTFTMGSGDATLKANIAKSDKHHK